MFIVQETLKETEL